MRTATLFVALIFTTIPAHAGDLMTALKALAAIEPAPTPDPELGPSWTYPGDIYLHLAGPNHNFDATGMTRQEAEDYHSDLHNAESRGLAVPAPAQQFSYSPEVFTVAQAGCPNGVCPIRAPVRSVAVGAVQRSRSVASNVVQRNRRRVGFLGRIVQRIRARRAARWARR